MKRTIVLTSLVAIFFFEFLSAQDDIQVGNQGRFGATTAAGAVYDYSNPSGVNFRLQLWGYVRFPGFYIVPAGTSLNELISIAGGPTEDALLNDIRVVQIREGSQTNMVKYDYNDLVWEENIESQINYIKLDAGDVVIVPGKPRYFVREDITFYTSLLTSIASITALVVSIIILTNQ